MTVPTKEAPANSVPAAAVIRGVQALSGIIGRKAFVGGKISQMLKPGLECGRGKGNSWCSGEMRRYQEEHRWRKRFTGPLLTLRNESQGSKWD